MTVVSSALTARDSFQELVRQREQLQNTDRRLDEINSNLRVSQKHIQGIKVNIYLFQLTTDMKNT